ncbi:MAG: MBL fold metallo-hydrolase RNA specificity domain-containing protein [Candidatus Micrarchaeota archaeon]
MFDESMNLKVGDFSISLDRSGSEHCYVSHAHSDHAHVLGKKEKKFLASEETFCLAGYKGERTRTEFDGVRMSLFNAGHILGATQLEVEADGRVYVYTGDFKMQDGLTTKGAEVRECDQLLIEGTYGTPGVHFPRRAQVYEEMKEWVDANSERGIILLGGYSIGKAQELVKFLNEYCGITPLVHEKIEKACRVYEKFGVKLDRVCTRSEESEELKRGNFVAVLPHNLVNTKLALGLGGIYNKRVVCALATGWSKMRNYAVHKSFTLSDHADFDEILEYVERSRARKIYCCHGNEMTLARELRERGYNAQPIFEANQSTL